MAKGKSRQTGASVVIYFSKDDECWIAHSLDTDQIGTGVRIVDALADVIRAVKALYELAKEDGSVSFFRKSPPEIRAMARKAKPLPHAFRISVDDYLTEDLP